VLVFIPCKTQFWMNCSFSMLPWRRSCSRNVIGGDITVEIVQNVNSNQVELAEDPVSFVIIYIVQYAQYFIYIFYSATSSLTYQWCWFYLYFLKGIYWSKMLKYSKYLAR
jgi:hypothetical protein